MGSDARYLVEHPRQASHAEQEVKIDRRRLLDLIREELVLILPDDFATGPPDSTDAWHPSEVEPLEDAWSGGDNIDTPIDHAYVETGESNAGPHSAVGFSGTPEPLGDEAGCAGCGCTTCDCQNFFPHSGEGLVDLVFLREADDIVNSPAPPPDGLVDVEPEEPEREPIVIQIKKKMKDVGISGPNGMFSQVGDVDEFEDLIRFIFEDVELDNRQLASVAIRISQDFLEDPEGAANLSTFNLD